MKRCALCAQELEADQPVQRFGEFAVNELDPLHPFSGGCFHRSCFEAHDLSGAARQRVQEWLKNVGPGRRFCALCGGRAGASADGLLELPFLVADPSHPLAAWNDALLHVECLQPFADRGRLLTLLTGLRGSSDWRGPGLDRAIAALAASD